MRYIALLRGINVGGHTVRMEHLRGLFREIGLADVRSYIQSGNVFFSDPSADRSVLASRIAGHLRDALGYEVPVFLRTRSELKQVVARDPFRDIVVTPDLRLCVAFTADRIPPLDLPLCSAKNDMAIVGASDYEAFMTWRVVGGRPPAFQSFLSKALQTQLTTRFFPTTLKILEAAKASEA